MLSIKARIKKYIDFMIYETLSAHKKKSDHPAVDILLKLHGYEQTLESKLPLDANGAPIPWYTYPAIEYFNQLDVRGLRVFEYGSGNSSLYWARKGAEVWSVEHDSVWYESMGTRSAQLKGLFLRESADEYAATISEVGGDFDIIVIDGVWRNQCAKTALPHLRKGGLIVLDNSDWYTDVSDFLKEKGFFQVDFNGFGPINNYCWTTSVLMFFNSHLTGHIRQPSPVGGIEVFKGEKW